jgi:transcriptional regulator with XRE-family HTH domain
MLCPGCLLLAWRQGRGLTQAQVAGLLRVHPRTIQRWERGTAPIPHCAMLLLSGHIPA